MAEFIFTHSYLLLILPLLSFVVITFGLARKYPRLAGQVAVLMAALNMLYGLGLAAAYYQHVLSRPELYPNRTLICFDLAWLNFSPGLTATLGIYLDPISMMMIVIITIISLLVNIYYEG
jgi:NADH-quinone oxidoreductase subunit L